MMLIKKLICLIVGHKEHLEVVLSKRAKEKGDKAFIDYLIWGECQYKADEDDIELYAIKCKRCGRKL